MSKGFYSAQDGHIVNLIPAVNITGGVTGAVFSMADYAHASIIVQIGVSAAAPTAIIVNACTNAAAAGATAIPFNLFACETGAGDVLGARVSVLAAGYVPSAVDNIFYVIELSAAMLPQGSPYVQLSITNGANSVIASAVAVLSGARYASDQSATVLL
jgi:hypothetical protein